jgi:hypothetical protein
MIGEGGALSDELKALVLRSLADIHQLSLDYLEGQFQDSLGVLVFTAGIPELRRAKDSKSPSVERVVVPCKGKAVLKWDTSSEDQDPKATGGVSLFDSVKVPAAGGRLHIAGEATSTNHGWIIGALNSGWRAVSNVLKGLSDGEELQQKLEANWDGIPDEEPKAAVANIGYRVGVNGDWA